MANQDEYIKTALRLPRHLHADATVAAQRAGHSLNAELVGRIGQSDDLAHLHRVIEQLSETMRTQNGHYGTLLTLILASFDRTVQALDEALLLAQYKNGTQEDILRLRDEAKKARTTIDQLGRSARNEFVHTGKVSFKEP